MKTTLLLLPLFLFSSQLLHAQIDKGRVQVGGQFSFSNIHYSQSSGGNNYVSLLVNPAIGRFYATNKLAGVFLNFGYMGASASSQTYSYGGGVYFRQYQPILKSLYVFAEEEATITYSRYKNPSTSNASALNSYAIGAGFRPGIAYDLTRKMQFEMAYNNLLSMSYNYSKSSQIFSLNSSLEGSGLQNLLVGFRFYVR